MSQNRVNCEWNLWMKLKEVCILYLEIFSTVGIPRGGTHAATNVLQHPCICIFIRLCICELLYLYLDTLYNVDIPCCNSLTLGYLQCKPPIWVSTLTALPAYRAIPHTGHPITPWPSCHPRPSNKLVVGGSSLVERGDARRCNRNQQLRSPSFHFHAGHLPGYPLALEGIPITWRCWTPSPHSHASWPPLLTFEQLEYCETSWDRSCASN